jgi:hypothetical protein
VHEALNLGESDLATDIAGFTHDPLGFVRYVFPWGEGELSGRSGPYAWQTEYLREIGEKLREGVRGDDYVGAAIQSAVSSGHGIGKSAIVSWLVLWALSTCDDARVVVTANTEAQLRSKTWPELQKWHRLAVNRSWFQWTATGLHSTQPGHDKTWRADALPWSANNSEAFAGLHNEGRRIVLIFDEASAIDDAIWSVAEGALTDTNTEILWCVFGNPTRASGRFRECFRQYRHRWAQRGIDAREVEGTNKEQIAQWVADYGEDSDFVKVRVRGVFPAQSMRQYIGDDDVDAAFGRHLRAEQFSFAPVIISCDPAWSGDDELVIGLRQGLMFKVLRSLPRNDNDVHVANMLANLEDEHKADAVFIDAGYGTGIYSAGKTMGRRWQLVWFGGKPDDAGCVNKRAEMWMLMKRWLKEGGAIPEDATLRTDLTGPETVPRIDGKIQLESKEDMKRRGLPSPNRGDALAITFAYPVAGKREAPKPRATTVADYNPLA